MSEEWGWAVGSGLPALEAGALGLPESQPYEMAKAMSWANLLPVSAPEAMGSVMAVSLNRLRADLSRTALRSAMNCNTSSFRRGLKKIVWVEFVVLRATRAEVCLSGSPSCSSQGICLDRPLLPADGDQYWRGEGFG